MTIELMEFNQFKARKKYIIKGPALSPTACLAMEML